MTERTFANAAEMIQFMRDTVKEPIGSLLALGAGNLGTEKAVFNLASIDQIHAIEWADSYLKEIRDIPNVISYKHDFRNYREVVKNRCDVTTLLDALEHIPKRDGKQLLKDLEETTDTMILLFVPIQTKLRHTYSMLTRHQHLKKMDNDVMNAHLSLWKPWELEKLGYEVTYDPIYHRDRMGPGHHWGAMVAVKYLEQSLIIDLN